MGSFFGGSLCCNSELLGPIIAGRLAGNFVYWILGLRQD